MAGNIIMNDNTQMPLLGLGTWKSKPGEVTRAVKDAIEIGYRHIDCAMIYENENEVGAAIKEQIDSGLVKREDLYIVSKLWNNYHRPDLVEVGLKESLEKLGLEYLDLYLIHSPCGIKEGLGLHPRDENGRNLYSDVNFVDTWKALEDCVKSGLTRSIGVSNFNSKQVQRILDNCTIKPVTNQVECHPYLNQKKLIDYCHERGVIITSYSPLGSPDRPWAKPGEVTLLQDPKILAIAENHGKTAAQILLRYQVQRGIPVIPKSVTKSRILENFDVSLYELTEEEMATLDSLDRNERYLHHYWVKDHPEFPFAIEF